MDTQIDHAHMGISTCIENDKSGHGCVPEQWATMRYHKNGVSAQYRARNISHASPNRN